MPYGQTEPGEVGKTTEDCQLSSSLVKGLSFKLINSSLVNHTIICIDNIAEFGSAQGNSKKKKKSEYL